MEVALRYSPWDCVIHMSLSLTNTLILSAKTMMGITPEKEKGWSI